MTDFARRNIEPGATVITDKMSGFDGLTAAGYGDERPVAPNTPSGRVANRRVDIAILDLGNNPTAPANQTTTTINELGAGK